MSLQESPVCRLWEAGRKLKFLVGRAGETTQASVEAAARAYVLVIAAYRLDLASRGCLRILDFRYARLSSVGLRSFFHLADAAPTFPSQRNQGWIGQLLGRCSAQQA